MQTREQKYAAKGFNYVSARFREYPEGDKRRTEYGSMAHKLPVLIRTAGLAQALSFVETRKKESHLALLDDLASTLEQDRKGLLERSRQADLDEYMLLTRYALDALLWFKRYAQSVLGVEASDETGEEQ